MKVIRADKLGFCVGVQGAIKLAGAATERGRPVYSLGPIIHNKQVVDRLAETGLATVESLDEAREGAVLIRAHGVPPETFEAISHGEREVVDATCALVRRAQNIVKKLHEEGYQVVMIGDADHPEVKGIIGYAPNVIVIEDLADLDRLPKRGRLGIVVQTTQSPKHFGAMVGEIVSRSFREIKVVNTLCLEVVRRQEAAVSLCDKVDVMFVLGGLHSANTRELARLCQEQGVPTYHLEGWGSFHEEFVASCETAGVAAGASTPSWVIDEFVESLEAL